MELSKDQVRDIALKSGFKLKHQSDNTLDLNEYVYTFAQELMSKCNSPSPVNSAMSDGKYITKQEAKEAIKRGEKIRHPNINKGQWIMWSEKTGLQGQDGCTVDYAIWQVTTPGWSIWKS